MKVTVVDREHISRTWGNGYRSIRQALRSVEIGERCPACGGERGQPHLRRMCEDDEWYDVHVWDNPCGHVDKYADVIAEASKLNATT